MTLETDLMNKISHLCPDARIVELDAPHGADPLRIAFSRPAPDQLIVDVFSDNAEETSAQAILIIDSLNADGLTTAAGTAQASYSHGTVLRDDNAAPIGYRMHFNLLVAESPLENEERLEELEAA